MRGLRLAAVASTLFAFAVTHLPAPSGVGRSDADTSRRLVRGAWQGLGAIASAVAGATGELRAWIPDFLVSDKTIHFALYLAPGALWALALRGRRSPVLLLGLLAAWAGADELSQHLLSRVGEWGDWVANVAGAATGIAAAHVLRPVDAAGRRGNS